MRRKYLLFGVGLGLGLSLVFLMGMAAEFLVVSGSLEVWQSSIYYPAFSGLTPDGECYLAVTNSYSGQTEVFLISKKLRKQFPDAPRPVGMHGSLTFFGHGPVDYERK